MMSSNDDSPRRTFALNLPLMTLGKVSNVGHAICPGTSHMHCLGKSQPKLAGLALIDSSCARSDSSVALKVSRKMIL